MKQPRLHHGVVEKIEGDILSGKLQCGEKLPPEAELAEALNVGRRAVREALQILQNRGLVEVRQGIGAFVRRNDLDNYLSSLTGNISSYLFANKGKLENVLELREVLETYGLRRILEGKKAEVVKQLRSFVAVQKEAAKTKDAARYDTAHRGFHRLIVESLDNPIMLLVYEQIIGLIGDKMRFYAGVPNQMERSVEEHEEIVVSLEKGDAARGLAAMKNHLSLAYANLKRA